MTGESSYQIQQGPQWLADLFVDPPAWVLALFVAGCILLVAMVVLGVRRNGGVPLEAKMAMAENGLIIGACAGGTLVSKEVLSLSYAGDVAVGVVAGILMFVWARRIVDWNLSQIRALNEKDTDNA